MLLHLIVMVLGSTVVVMLVPVIVDIDFFFWPNIVDRYWLIINV